MSLNRTLAGLIDASGELTSGGGLDVYATLDDLPTTGLTSGDQAYVSATSRFYISNGSGWYNVALVNATPNLTISPSGAIELNTDGSTTTITLTATDSDYPDAALTFSVDSDGSFGGLGTISQDSSVFTITPFSEDSATTQTSTLTFKASDGISFGSGTSILTLQFKAANSNYTTLLTKADTAGTDDQVDASTNAHAITENGNTTSTAFSPYHPGGYSTYFDGSGGDWVKTDTHADFAFQAGDFTVECWYYPVSKAQNYPRIFHFGTYWNSNQAWTLLDRHNTNNTKFWLNSYSGISIISTTTVENNKWYHLAVERSGNTITLYVNGVAEGTADVSTNNYPDASSTSYLNIGNVSNGSNLNEAAANGYVRDLRVVKGSAVYTTNFTVPSARLTAVTNTKFLFDSLLTQDISGEGHTASANGSVTSQRFGPYDYEAYTKANYGGSVYFDGNGDYLSVAGSNLHSVGSVSGEPFTIEFWYNHSAVGSNGNGLISKGTAGSTGSGDILAMDLNPSTRAISCTLDGLYSGYEIISSTLLKENAWYHIALVKNSSNVYTLYINGKADGTYTATGTISASSNFYIGTNYYSPTDIQRQSQAYFSDVRVVSDAVYTSNFTPPTAPLTAITNTYLLTCTNKNDIWDASSGSQVMTKSGNVTASNTQRKFATSSAMYFDGSGDYLDFVKKDEYHFSSSDDFTVEGWWYFAANSGTIPFILMGTGVDATPAHYSDWIMYRNGSGNFSFGQYSNTGNTFQVFGSFSPTLNTWYHIAVSRSGTNLRGFIDGVQQGSTITDSTAWTNKSGSRPLRMGRFIGGGGTSSYFNGYAQDVRISKGLARYTSNFTPPTTEFGG